MPLHSQVKKFLDALAEQNSPGWEELTPHEGRDVFASLTDLFGEVEKVARVQELDNLRIYTPTGTGPFPAVIYFHGGGWVLGSRDTHDVLCRRLANAAECVVVSVDYPLSPESQFPEPLETCYEATRFISQSAEEFEIDPSRIAVAGDSAGGNLAAAVALLAVERGTPSLSFQLLFYPVMDHDFSTQSYHEFAEGFGLTKSSMQWFWQQYLGSDGDGQNPCASPLRSSNLSQLPPAHIITAEYDVLRDEGEAYATKLIEAGVPTTVQCYEGMIHGFTHLAGIFDKGRQSLYDAASVLRKSFSTCQEITE